MQRERKERVHGPYEHRARWRVILVGADGSRRRRTFATRSAADAYAEVARGEAQSERTVSAAIEAFVEHARIKGVAPATIESYEDRLAAMLAGVGARPVRYLIGRGGELYAAAQTYPAGHRSAGRPRAVDTHRGALVIAKQLGRWLVKQRWLRADPFSEVEPVGRRRVGADKQRHTVNEARRLRSTCLELGARDPGAVIALGYLLLGERASELVDCDVRHLDDGGRLLWVPGTKTDAARRRLLVPDELVPLLLALAGERTGNAPLFLSTASRRWPAGRRWSRHMAYNHVRRICGVAGVPELGPQGLRRTQATLATDAGETGLAVARHLGHATGAAPAITHRAYVGREAARTAAVERGLVVLQGGRVGNSAGNSSRP
jgi:integrase